MAEAISNTSPLLYLHRIGVVDWLAELFREIWIPPSVALELEEGRRRGYDVLRPESYPWMRVTEPQSVPSEWLTLDLGSDELASMALALEHPEHVLLLDDALARRIAQAAGLEVWGTLRVLLEAKAQGLTPAIVPLVTRLEEAGLWLSDDIRRRVLALAGET